MRRAVKKPTAASRTHSQLVGAVVHSKASVHRIDGKRLAHAKATRKSAHISRFGTADALESAGGTRPQIGQAVVRDVAPAPAPKRQSEVLFERAMMQATSHLQPRHNPVKRRRVSKRLRNWSAASLAVVLLGGFIAYQNLASIQLHLASSHIGFTAAVPAHPAGFSLGHFSYQPGSVALHFHSNSNDDRSFAINEQPAVGNATGYLAGYHRLQVGSTTVYVDDQNNAVWVSHGILYQLTNHEAIAGRALSDLVAST
jgi:hypothetical protein